MLLLLLMTMMEMMKYLQEKQGKLHYIMTFQSLHSAKIITLTAVWGTLRNAGMLQTNEPSVVKALATMISVNQLVFFLS